MMFFLARLGALVSIAGFQGLCRAGMISVFGLGCRRFDVQELVVIGATC